MDQEPSTSGQRSNRDRCINCGTSSQKLAKTSIKVVSSDEERISLSTYLEIPVTVGDVICQKCKNYSYLVKSKIKKRENEQNQAQEPSSQDYFSSPPSQVLSQSSTESNPSFKMKAGKPSVECVTVPIRRVISSNSKCCLCFSTFDLMNVPENARLQLFQKRNIYIKKGNRCCINHIINARFYEDDLKNFQVQCNESEIPHDELKYFISHISARVDSSILDDVGEFYISEERLRVFTGLNWDMLIFLKDKLKSLKKSHNRNQIQALVVFLFKLRSGNSNELIASIFDLDRPQMVSEYCASVINAFEKDVLPTEFGYNARTREDLIANHTNPLIALILGIIRKLILICDGTYARHQKSSNNAYQKKSYSGHKKLPLGKPFTICTTDGTVVAVEGPFNATEGDAPILKKLIDQLNGLSQLMKPGDVFILDRGFRDVKSYLEEKGYVVLMPELKGDRKQLTAREANNSRRTTKFRWPVEAVHGIIGKKYRLLHNQLDNKYLPNLGSLCRIACYLNNEFGKKLGSDHALAAEIADQMNRKNLDENELATLVAEKRWSFRKTLLHPVRSDVLPDFPRLSDDELKIFFTGTYQLSQSISYLAEMCDQDGNVDLEYVKENPQIIKFSVKSRHIKRNTYRCYIHYKPDSNGPNRVGIEGIIGHCCECANGLRTIGCCSHVAAIIYYLSRGRYLSRILRPAEILTNIFDNVGAEPVIEEDSDDD